SVVVPLEKDPAQRFWTPNGAAEGEMSSTWHGTSERPASCGSIVSVTPSHLWWSAFGEVRSLLCSLRRRMEQARTEPSNKMTVKIRRLGLLKGRSTTKGSP